MPYFEWEGRLRLGFQLSDGADAGENPCFTNPGHRRCREAANQAQSLPGEAAAPATSQLPAQAVGASLQQPCSETLLWATIQCLLEGGKQKPPVDITFSRFYIGPDMFFYSAYFFFFLLNSLSPPSVFPSSSFELGVTFGPAFQALRFAEFLTEHK